jgi:hypothetical protein
MFCNDAIAYWYILQSLADNQSFQSWGHRVDPHEIRDKATNLGSLHSSGPSTSVQTTWEGTTDKSDGLPRCSSLTHPPIHRRHPPRSPPRDLVLIDTSLEPIVALTLI